MMRKWTDAQKQAIEARNGTVLVSAAAGSGKTAVLVERVIQYISDSENPVDVEKLLVVTFTKAAASEMKERLSKRLSEMIREQPGNSYLRRQKMYLPNASISTMDSFCGKLVKENFEKAGILPDYKMLSDAEHEIMKREVVGEVLEEIYNLPEEETRDFLQLFTNGRNDENLIQSIFSLYDFAMASQNPFQWVEKCFEDYYNALPLKLTKWGKNSLERLCELLCFIRNKMQSIIDDAPEATNLSVFVHGELSPLVEIIDKILSNNESLSWDQIKELTDSLALNRWPRLPKEEAELPVSYELKQRRDSLKKQFSSAQAILGCSEDEYMDDITYLRPVISVLKQCTERFMALLRERKDESNTYYFSDILHLALGILVSFNPDGTYEKTPLAKELSDNFAEILIDEFQDTNEAQDALFSVLSKNNSNKFMVGDVKQSIYRFRQAMPEIFMGYKNSFNSYKSNNYPATISLDRNFRSRKGVVEGINYFFDYLMTEKSCGIEYRQDERLVYSGDYEESNETDTYFNIVDTDKTKGPDIEAEARYIGNKIKELVSSKMTVGKKGEERPVKYSDICILLRAVKNKANVFARELNKMNIPVYYQKQGGFFESKEIVTMISMLKVIDNPVQDVPLVSVILSPLFSFTEDDLARYRCDCRKGSFYNVLKSQYEKDEKVKDFLDFLSLLRTLAVTMDIGSLIRRVLELTAYDSMVCAMDNGEKRVMNLEMLISYAENFEAQGGSGLSGFIRYLDKINKNNQDLEGANEISESDNVVRIMSIHKSKGLEFPVVFVANLSASFSVADYSKIKVHKKLGIGISRYFPELNKEFHTQPYVTIKQANKSEEIAELMRVLYVAMTRAKEKLYLVGSLNNWSKKAEEMYYAYYSDWLNCEAPLYLMNSFMQWILLSLSGHPDCNTGDFIKSDSVMPRDQAPHINFLVAEKPDEVQENDKTTEDYAPDEALLTEIAQKLSYEYPYASISALPVKYAASSLDSEETLKYLATENPAFSGAGELTPAQRGTLTHRFMELCDFDRASQDLEAEVSRLIETGGFTKQEANAVNRDKIKDFFRSQLYSRISCAQSFAREREFSMTLPLKTLFPELSNVKDENVMVQGVIDGLIINGNCGEIVDYKTDKVSCEEELVERYLRQMRMYKYAAKECFGLEDVNVTLYSFYLSKEISVKL